MDHRGNPGMLAGIDFSSTYDCSSSIPQTKSMIDQIASAGCCGSIGQRSACSVDNSYICATPANYINAIIDDKSPSGTCDIRINMDTNRYGHSGVFEGISFASFYDCSSASVNVSSKIDSYAALGCCGSSKMSTCSPSPTSETTTTTTTTAAPQTTATTTDPVKDRAESTTMIETDITFDGMSAAEFKTNKKEITKAIADTLEVHPSMLIVTVKSSRRRRLTADGDQVTLEVQIFVTPEKATAMEKKVMVVKTSSGSSVLSSKIASAAGFSNTLSASVSAPVTESNQTPPPAPQNSKSATNSDKKKKRNNWMMLGGIIGGVVFLLILLFMLFMQYGRYWYSLCTTGRNKKNNTMRRKESTRLEDDNNNNTGLEMGSAVAMHTNPMKQIHP